MGWAKKLAAAGVLLVGAKLALAGGAGEALAGMVVELGERRDEYVKATTEYGYTGYIPKACLLEDELQSCDWAGRTLRQVTRAALDVMAEPRVQSWTLETLPLADYQKASPLFQEDLYTAISLDTCVQGRTSYGGPAPASVLRQVGQMRAFLQELGD